MEGKEEEGSAVAVADAPCSSQTCGVERRGGGVLVKSRCARCSRAAVLLVRRGIAGHHGTTAAFWGASYLKNTNNHHRIDLGHSFPCPTPGFRRFGYALRSWPEVGFPIGADVANRMARASSCFTVRPSPRRRACDGVFALGRMIQNL